MFLNLFKCVLHNYLMRNHKKNSLRTSESQIVFILATGIMGNPQNNSRKHESDALRNIGVTVIVELLRVVVQDILQNQDSLEKGE